MTFEQVLNMSYANLVLYSSIIPPVDETDSNESPNDGIVIDADDPKNQALIDELLSE